MFKESTKRVQVYSTVFGFSFWFLLQSCGSPPKEMEGKLQEIGKSDLEFIVSELSEKARHEAVLAKPFFVVDKYEEFKGDSARVFQAYAVLVFFYLDPSLDLCQVRKYRYNRSARVWERFEAVLEHFPPKYAGGQIAGDSLISEEAEKP